ncbi:MAG: aminopeptidase P family protein [Gemmatimonadetes bacterium]|nr:aminopeptidase P family protein [Gemmatimonadota bacterium]
MRVDCRRSRLDRLREALVGRGLDALVVSHPANVRYLTGFTGSSAVVVVAHSAVSLFTDSRYDVQAEAEVACVARVEIVSGDLWGVGPGAGVGAVEKAVDAAPDLRRVGFEAHYVSARAAAALGGHSARVEFVPTSEVVEAFRAVKDAGEVAAIGAAARVASEALDAILPIIRPGLRELDVAAALERELRVRGSEWHPFPTIAASGPRSAMPHAGTTERTVEAGDWLLLDFGAQVEGYCADVTRTFVVGRRADERQREVYEAVREAQARAISQIRAGMTGREADEKARSVIDARGFGDAFRHSLGHGLGLEVHEAPRVSRTNEDPLPDGCVVTVEPGVYLPGWGGVRIEDDVHVTAEGAELLSDGGTELIELV